ncbi:MAG: hypothetical protein ABI889_11295 [Gemmatimonadota bacterium]
MQITIRFDIAYLALALATARSLPSQGDYAAPIMAGISNHGGNAD